MDEFIFDDEVDEVGSEVEAHCPKCKSDTTHVIISKYEDEIRRVQCNPCGDVHAYRKPRGETTEEEEPSPKRKTAKAKPTYEQIMAKNKKPPRAYAIGEYFKELEVISHPKFGLGYVTDNIGADKIEVTFEKDKRVLIHNRKGLNLPVSAAGKKLKGKFKATPPKPLPLDTVLTFAAGKKGAARPAAKKPVVVTPPPKAAKPAKKAAPAKAAKKPAARPVKKAAKPKPAKQAAKVAAKKPAKKAAKPAKKKAR